MTVVGIAPNVTSAANGLLPDFILEIGKVANWLQAVGIILIIWVGFEIGFFILNYKRRKYLKKLISDLERLEKKIDKLIKKH